MTAQQSLHTLTGLASGAPDTFKLSFRRLRTAFPTEVTEACLWYVAAQKTDSATQQMALWLISDARYLQVLFDPATLPFEKAGRAIAHLKPADPSFYVRFHKVANELTDPKNIGRALGLISALDDFETLLPLLRTYSHHTNERIRSKAVKLLCQLRPNRSLIERQMESMDPRVRASAIEALWYARCPDSAGLFTSALSDPHHRVVANALVGLHLQESAEAFDKLLDMARHPQAFFRSAAAWAFGFVREERATPALETLATDSSPMVRKRALQGLLALHQQDASERSLHEDIVNV